MRDLDSGCHGRPAAMDRVEAERIHVIRKTARTADPGNDDELFAGNPELRKNGLHGGENGVITAAGTPADFLVRLKILLRKNWHGRRGHLSFTPGYFFSGLSPEFLRSLLRFPIA